jgi:long-chain fatty acid transport protein
MRRMLAVLAVLQVGLSQLAADDDHYINILIGERAAGMGGAYTAIADGPEGAYYNPAGLAFTPASYFSLSTNAVQFKRLRYVDIWGEAEEQVDYVRDTFSFIPNFFGVIQKGKSFTMALTISSLDNESYDQRDKITIPRSLLDGTPLGNEIINVNFNHSSTLQEVGPSLAFLLGQRLSAGFSLFVAYADRKYLNQNVIRFDSYSVFQIGSIYDRRQLYSLRPVVGIQWSPTDSLVLGYSAAMAVPLFGVYTRQATAFQYYDETAETVFGYDTAYAFADNAFVLDNTVTYKNLLADGLFEPTNLKNSLGVAYFASKSLLFSGDVYAYVPLPLDNGQRVFTWNAALGMEYYLSPYFPLRLGVYTNNANTPPVVEGTGRNRADHVNLYGGSLAVGYTTADFGINIGATASFGRGRAQLIADSTATQIVDATSLQVFISGGYQY